jgi:hypothetical protein
MRQEEFKIPAKSWANAPIVPPAQEAESGGWLEPRSSRPTWAT